jgi:hypothetical protein
MTLSAKLVPSSGCLFGMWVGTSCGDTAGLLSTRIHNIETTIDRTDATNGLLNIFHDYTNWDTFTSAFPAGSEATLASEGRLFLCNWTPKTAAGAKLLWADIAAGTYDSSYVIPTATKMRDFGQPFFLVFHTEANHFSSDFGVTDTWGTSAQYVAAYQHVWNVFQSVGVTNVVWVWNVTGYGFTNMPLYQAIYPGDTYVDWGSFDPYSGGGSGGWQDYAYVTGTKYPLYQWWTGTHPTYNKTGAHDKPMMWQEWGAEEYNLAPNGGAYPNTKAGFFDQVHSGLRGGDFPLTKAIVCYNSTGGGGQNCIDSSSQALAAFKSLAADPFFNPDRSPTPPPPPGTIAPRASASAAVVNATSKQLTFPPTAQAGDGALLWHTCTRSEFRQACEGTNAANVTIGNSGAKGSNPLDGVSATPPTYDTAQKHSGASSWLAGLVAQTTRAGYWDTSFGTQVSGVPYWGEKYFRIPSVPPAAIRLFQQAGVAGSPAFQWGLAIDVTTGKLVIRDGGGTNRAVSTAAPALNTQHRVEWQCDWNGSTTTVIAKLFLGANVDGTTPDETLTSTAFTQAAAGGRYYFGALSSAAQTWAPWVDDFRLSKNGWIGLQGISPSLTTNMAALGWTLVDTKQVVDGSVEMISRLYRKTVASGDPGSTLTLTTDVAAHGSILLDVYSGADQLAFVDVEASSSKTTDSATVVTPTTPTTAGAGEWIVSAAFVRDNPGAATTSWGTLPGSEVQRAVSFPSGATDGRIAGIVTDDAAAHGVGTYGAKTFTSNATSYLGIGWTVALLPAASGGGGTQHAGFLVHPS